MVFVGEMQKPARNTFALQGGESRHALGIDNAEIERAMDDQGWGLPVLYEVDRIVGGVAGRVFPWGTAMFPFWEPQFFGVVVCHALIEVAVVDDQGFEPIGVAVDPIDHVAAVRRAGRNRTVAVEP